MAAFGESVREAFSPGAAAGFALVLLVGSLVWSRVHRGFERRGPATRAYVALRQLAARRGGAIGPSTPPAEVVRLFARAVPEAEADARAVVETYCASAFGGVEPSEEATRALAERLRRLRKLA